jgi:hypothetical protein
MRQPNGRAVWTVQSLDRWNGQPVPSHADVFPDERGQLDRRDVEPVAVFLEPAALA